MENENRTENRLINFDKMFVDCWCDCKIPLWYGCIPIAFYLFHTCSHYHSSGMLDFNSFSTERTEMWCCCCCCCCYCHTRLLMHAIHSLMLLLWHRFLIILSMYEWWATIVCLYLSVYVYVCCADVCVSVCEWYARFGVLLEPVSVSMVVWTNKIKSKHSFHTVEI